MRVHVHVVVVALLLGCMSIEAARQLRQQGPPTDEVVGILRGNPQELRAVGTLLRGANRQKLKVPGSAAQFARDGFVVSLMDDTTPEEVQAAVALARGRSAEVVDISGPAFRGLAILAPPGLLQQAAMLQDLIDNGKVSLVEPNIIMITSQLTQGSATWGLDRIDQRARPLNGNFSYNSTGAGVTAYIVDTGIAVNHTQFLDANGTSRVVTSVNYIVDPPGTGSASPTFSGDCNGHGTHVAGTVGGITYGVAKAVTLVGVRVLGCDGSGSTAGIISSLNWVTSHCNTTATKKWVVNMSLGGGASSTLDRAVTNSIAAGLVYAIAAGNSNANACNSSPARVANAITVAATTSTDAHASFSNFGTCVDVFAPGASITSAWNTASTAINTISGTSMASPHVAGVVAQYLGTLPSPMTPSLAASVPATINTAATASVVTSPGTGSPNRLLFTGY